MVLFFPRAPSQLLVARATMKMYVGIWAFMDECTQYEISRQDALSNEIEEWAQFVNKLNLP